MREIEAAEIKAKRQLEFLMSDLFEDAERHGRRKADLPVIMPSNYSFVAVLAVIAISVITSLATVMIYCDYHHLLN